jgi:hypothetical protein
MICELFRLVIIIIIYIYIYVYNLYLVYVGSERGGRKFLCERALLVWARPNIYVDLIYIYILVD